MKVIDLIIQLQKFDPNMNVMLDVTHQQSKGGFHFHPPVTVEEITEPVNNDTFIVVSPYNFDEIGEDDETNANLN